MPEKNKKTAPKKPTLKDQIKSLNNDIESEKAVSYTHLTLPTILLV